MVVLVAGDRIMQIGDVNSVDIPEGVKTVVEVGLTPIEVIQSATLRPAQMQGVEQDLGTVTEGKYADMVIVDGDPLQDITLLQHKIVLVIKGGRVYNPSDQIKN